MINLVASAQRCLRLELYRSNVDAFRGDERIREFGCDGFRTFTPGPDGGGTYTLRVIRDGRYRGTQNYRLQVAPATEDDGAPGMQLQNGQTVAGSLSPRTIDVRDVYRFSSTGESMMTASLRTAPNARFDLVLLTDTGSEVECACDGAGPTTLRQVVERGHYFLAVRSTTGSKGTYKLTLLVREVTSTDFLVDGSTRVELAPDQSAQADGTGQVRDRGAVDNSRRRKGAVPVRPPRPVLGLAVREALQRPRRLGRVCPALVDPALGRPLARTRGLLGDAHRGPERGRVRRDPGRGADARVEGSSPASSAPKN